ncbi:hypothetical protein SAMN04489727_1705 [Amycolatopsis tolypomycina]|uniref:Uncharacterized protein n=1 Tax=Amycolatopsis tolypomycina TaxID=208445 RepID=A0A1H4JBD4_9PSEU|nr:hypothetical protein [Amycolatopsis tolypomycina]SEB43355.1 hypothetical protein SAMN04489727_1705 [Amycolatopsis tolypomycina]
MCDASANGSRWADLNELGRRIYRNRIQAMRRQGFIAVPGQQAELDDVRQALMDMQAQLRGIRSAARAGDDLGRVAYERYSGQVQARSVSGDPLPSWAELRRDKPNIANAWVWAAAAVSDVVLRGARNGAHAVAEEVAANPTQAAAREREARAQAEAHPDAGGPR